MRRFLKLLPVLLLAAACLIGHAQTLKYTVCVPTSDTTSTTLSLTKPGHCSLSWDTQYNHNMDVIDAAITALQSATGGGSNICASVTGDSTSITCGLTNRAGDTATKPSSVLVLGTSNLSNNTGNHIIAIGEANGNANAGNEDIFIGDTLNGCTGSVSHAIVFGDHACADSSNEVVLGSSANTSKTKLYGVLDINDSPIATSNLADWTNAGTANGYAPIWNSTTSKWAPGPVTATSSYPTAVTLTASSSAELDFTSCIATARNYELLYSDIVPQTSGANLLLVQVSTDGGSTYVSTGYHYNRIYVGETDSGLLNNVTSSGYVLWGPDVSTTSTFAISGAAQFDNPASSTHYKTFAADARGWNGAGNFYHQTYDSNYTGATTAVNAVRVLFSTGNIVSGTVTCQPLP